MKIGNLSQERFAHQKSILKMIKVCDELDIQLHKANFSDEYWERVFTFFLSEHAKGRTLILIFYVIEKLNLKHLLIMQSKLGLHTLQLDTMLPTKKR